MVYDEPIKVIIHTSVLVEVIIDIIVHHYRILESMSWIKAHYLRWTSDFRYAIS